LKFWQHLGKYPRNGDFWSLRWCPWLHSSDQVITPFLRYHPFPLNVGYSPIETVCLSQNVSLVSSLIEKCGLKKEQDFSWVDKAMISACQGGNIEIVDYLFTEFFRIRKCRTKTWFKSFCKPTEIACAQGNVALLQYLRKVHKFYQIPEKGVQAATRGGKIEMIDFLFTITNKRQSKKKQKLTKRKRKRKQRKPSKKETKYPEDSNDLFQCIVASSLVAPDLTVLKHLCCHSATLLKSLNPDLRVFRPIIPITSLLRQLLTQAGFII
jgi:hypothetical protein